MKAADVALRVALVVGLVLAASLGYAVYDSVANAPDVRAAEDVAPRYTPEPASASSQGTEPEEGADDPAPTEVSQPAPEPQTAQAQPPPAQPQPPAPTQPQAPQVAITVTPDAAAQQQYQRDLEAAEESQRLLQEQFAAEQEASRREAEAQEAAAREEQRRRAELQAAADAERFRAAVAECKRLVLGVITSGTGGLGGVAEQARRDCERDPYGTVERFFQ